MFLELKNTWAKSANSMFVILFSLLLIYLVFFLDVDITRYRSIQQIWNLGHVFLFFGLSYLVVKAALNHSGYSVYTQFGLISVGAVLLGILIEYLQTLTGRDQSSYDVLLDWLGACIAFVVFSNALLKASRFVRISFRTGVIILMLLSLMPMLNIIIDDIQQRNQFPILVANESVRELSRFHKNNVTLRFVANVTEKPNKKVLRMDFIPGLNPTASLGAFNQNWSQYNYLSFDIFSPISVASLNVRIHDQRHERNGYRYRDRFNYSIQLSSGWNKIKISLADVKNAPLKRDMNMQEIQQLMFFKLNLRQPIYFLLGPVKLEK
ncbi:hypothetical protein MNBD_GAMMA23-2577 [hydrothermal vent metagenome]|uniref:Uncharacterized protein n=1 Tax=hydrothermal vent metagenome TaxID=652676 RepID=A0A3B1ABD0_9ZZZZ